MFGLVSTMLHLRFPLFFFFFLTCAFHVGVSFSGSRALCTGLTTSLTIQIFTGMVLFSGFSAWDPPPFWQSKFSLEWLCLVGLVYCSRNSQTSLFSNFFIKNGSHGTIHIFKNYFATMFSIFSKICGIQMDPKWHFLKKIQNLVGLEEQNQISVQRPKTLA